MESLIGAHMSILSSPNTPIISLRSVLQICRWFAPNPIFCPRCWSRACVRTTTSGRFEQS